MKIIPFVRKEISVLLSNYFIFIISKENIFKIKFESLPFHEEIYNYIIY